MNITEKIINCKEKLKIYEKEIFVSFLIILTGFLSFGLGRLSTILKNKTPVKIHNVESLINSENINNSSLKSVILENEITPKKIISIKTAEQTENGKIYVASKNGIRYYFVWCEGVKKIKEENKIWFKTKEEAEKTGLTPAKNCKGL